MTKSKEKIFALDIGTRTVVGVLLEAEEDHLKLICSEVIEHQKRSMLDGQIHNVNDVTEQVKKIKNKLEEKSGVKLEKVGIAAAGRALKTTTGYHKLSFEHKKQITAEDIKTLEFAAIQNAQKKLTTGKDKEQASGYHFVGYTLLQNKLDGIKVGNLINQRGREIEIDLIATFLPRIVIESLLTVIKEAGLSVDHLTLEPIAAANIIVPQQMYNFNLALVDIGAGTSDIAITKDGAIIGYDMVPVAGDEITEAICQNYMVDYHTAETIKGELNLTEEVEIKDILDQKIKIPTANIIKNIAETTDKLAKLISNAILKLNNQAPQAVICIGGGSLTPLLKEKLAKHLNLPKNRVGVKDGEEVTGIKGRIEGISGTQSITPFGIAVSSKNNKNRANFIDVEINGDLVHLFTLTPPKVSDALLAAELDIRLLKASTGLALGVEVNSKLKMIPGTMGTAGRILLNGSEASIDTEIKAGDSLEVTLGQAGEDGSGIIADVVPDLPTRKILLNGKKEEIKAIYYCNGTKVSIEQQLSEGDQISYTIPQTIGDILSNKLDLNLSQLKSSKIKYYFNDQEESYQLKNYTLKLNGEDTHLEEEVASGDELNFEKEMINHITIKDILPGKNLKDTIHIIFNDKTINVPIADYQLLKNNQPGGLNDIINPGDRIEYKQGELLLNQLLNYIDYKIPTTLKGKVIIKKNGSKAQLIEPLTEGDQVDIYLEESK